MRLCLPGRSSYSKVEYTARCDDEQHEGNQHSNHRRRWPTTANRRWGRRCQRSSVRISGCIGILRCFPERRVTVGSVDRRRARWRNPGRRYLFGRNAATSGTIRCSRRQLRSTSTTLHQGLLLAHLMTLVFSEWSDKKWNFHPLNRTILSPAFHRNTLDWLPVVLAPPSAIGNLFLTKMSVLVNLEQQASLPDRRTLRELLADRRGLRRSWRVSAGRCSGCAQNAIYMQKPQNWLPGLLRSSSTRIRTWNPSVNSRLLYH